MKFFEKRPLLRLIFLPVYLTLAVLLVLEPSFINILIALIMLFYCYVTLVKAGIIKSETAANIKSFGFDLTGIIFSVLMIIYVIKLF